MEDVENCGLFTPFPVSACNRGRRESEWIDLSTLYSMALAIIVVDRYFFTAKDRKASTENVAFLRMS